MAYKFGWLSAYELTEIGIDVNNHPVLDIDYKTSDVMKNRCFADNLEAINKLTESYIKGSSNFGISLICKHFPGHGYVKPDTHKSVAVDNRQIKTIFENDIQAFINAIENKIQKAKTDPLPMPSSVEELKERLEAKNLLGIYSSLNNSTLQNTVENFSGKNFSEFKNQLSDLLVKKIEPISLEIKKLLNDQPYLDKILLEGVEKANSIASKKIDRIKEILGF